MIIRISMAALCLTLTLVGVSRGADAPREIRTPLVVVNDDTVTTHELRLELDMMLRRDPDKGATSDLEPESILRRLIENELIRQEGYRMELNENFSVTNQVHDLARTKGIVALLDSVSLSVPDDTPDLKEARKAAVAAYIDGLKAAQSVSVDSTLLRSLDYGSTDAAVQQDLHDSKQVLAVIPSGPLTVARFSRVLRFEEFHGLEGKPDAAQRRDKAFDEWITEAILSYQVRIQKIDQRPAIRDAARDLEHFLVRQETIKALLETPYEPKDDEIKKYYEENAASFMAPVRIKMKSKKLNTEEAAKAFREKLSEGAEIEWLAEQDPEVVPGNDPFPYDWFAPEKLGLKPDEAKVGFIPEPYGVPGGWVVAIVSEVEQPTPKPLRDCRSSIIARLKTSNRQSMMKDIMARLKDASQVTILPGAEDVVRSVLEEVR